MLISQMEASNYSYFDAIEPKVKRSANVNAVKYIKKLAALTNTDISNWDIVALFKHPEKDGFLVTDKTAINQIFFKFREVAPTVQTTLSDDMTARLIQLQKKRRATSANHIRDRALSKERDAKSYYNTFLNLLGEAATLRKQYEIMIGHESSYPHELAKILAEGFWELDTVTDDLICVRTKHDIHLNFVNKKHGAYMNVNLGRFLIKYNVGRASVKCVKYDNNLTHNGYYHPHVSSDGDICFGEISNEVTEYLSSGVLTKVLELIQKALTAYNDNSAYANIHKFYLERIAYENRISVEDIKPDGTFDPALIGSEPRPEDGEWVEIDASASREEGEPIDLDDEEDEGDEELGNNGEPLFDPEDYPEDEEARF